MDITETIDVADRAAWRKWLQDNHDSAKEIWLICYNKASGKSRVSYLESVEEALCFGWVDGIKKKLDDERSVQRFTPRQAKSHWTELNKERARRLIAAGKMTDAGLKILPDLTLQPLQIADDVLATLKADPVVWENFENFPDSYKRIRIAAIEEARKQPEMFKTLLATFVDKTRQNKMFGSLE